MLRVPRFQRMWMHTGILLTGAMMSGGILSGEASAQATIGGEWREDIRSFAQQIIDSGLAPGLGVGIAVGDWVVFEEGFGSADLRAGRGVGAQTPFYIASTTKSLTALAAILLVERGELDLDAPIERYIPSVRLPEGVAPGSIRVRHLVTLTHGLSGGGPIVVRTAFTGAFDPESLPGLLRFHEPTGSFGEFVYDNLGFNLLGMVLEHVTGLSWQDAIEREVLNPIGMRSTSAYLSRMDRDAIALPHGVEVEGGFARIDLQKADGNLHAAGGHFATAGDMARYLAVHLSRGSLHGQAVLPAAPIAAAHEVHAAQARSFGPFLRHGWGYGWDIGSYEGETLVHRFGSFSGYRSHVSFMPDRNVGVAVLTNGDGMASPATDLLATYIYDRMAGVENVERTFAARLAELQAQAEAGRRAMAEDRANRSTRLRPLRHPLEAFAGRYESGEMGTIEFRVVAGGLEFHFGIARGRAEVFDADQDALRIEIGGSGAVAQFRFDTPEAPAGGLVLQGVRFTRAEG